MNDFKILATKNTPAVTFNSAENLITLSGKSYPEDSRIFYDKLSKQIFDLISSEKFTFVFDFEYVSSSSIASILEMLKQAKATFTKTQFIIKFYQESGDDDINSIVENYQKILKMPIGLIQK